MLNQHFRTFDQLSQLTPSRVVRKPAVTGWLRPFLIWHLGLFFGGPVLECCCEGSNLESVFFCSLILRKLTIANCFLQGVKWRDMMGLVCMVWIEIGPFCEIARVFLGRQVFKMFHFCYQDIGLHFWPPQKLKKANPTCQIPSSFVWFSKPRPHNNKQLQTPEIVFPACHDTGESFCPHQNPLISMMGWEFSTPRSATLLRRLLKVETAWRLDRFWRWPPKELGET